MTKIIALVNHKGGVGKTTTTANLGVALARAGYKTLLIDLDAQHNLTDTLTEDPPTETITGALKGPAMGLPIVQLRHNSPNLWLVASDRQLTGIDSHIEKRSRKEYVLKTLLAPVMDQYDYILLDCPPALKLVTINALVVATDIYIVTTPEVLPVKGLETITEVFEAVKGGYNSQLELSGVIITRYNVRKNLHNNIIDMLKHLYGEAVFNTKIRENISISESPLYHMDVITYQPTCNGAKDYINLAKEITQTQK